MLLAVAIASAVGDAARAESLTVQVRDGRNGEGLGGAFVQVGPYPGDPIPNNWGWTGPGGRIVFSDPRILGPQTVTAGFSGYALLTVVRSAVDSISLVLHPAVPDSALPEPKAEIGGSVSGIATQNNDGNLDIGMVYPAVHLSSLLAQRTLPFEVPADTVNFPVLGPTILPGNVVIPTQVEFFIFTFSKPHYHFYVPDQASYDFLVVAGRLPLSALGGTDQMLNLITMRELGAERNVAVNGDRTLNLSSDLNMTQNLTVLVPEAPHGSEVFVSSVADLPVSQRSLFFDAKSALRDTLSAFRLSGMNPAGDLADAVPYVAGYYGDSSSAHAYQAGRVDRTPLVLPATRTLGSFYLLPDLQQEGDQFTWTDVSRPGVTPAPTWSVATFRIDAVTRGDTTVTPRTVWEAWALAGDRSIRLPVLAPDAPGGLPDLNQTPEADRLVWDHLLGDPAGSLGQVMQDPFSTLTRWSQRTIEILPPIVEANEVGLGTAAGGALKFRIAPNPGREIRDILWDRPFRRGQLVAWTLVDLTGRQLSTGSFVSSGQLWDQGVLQVAPRLATGIYWIRIRAGRQVGTVPLVVAR